MEYFHPERTELIGESGYIETLCGIRERLAPYLLTERFASFDGTELSWEGYLAENARGAVVILHGFTEFPGKYLEMAWIILTTMCMICTALSSASGTIAGHFRCTSMRTPWAAVSVRGTCRNIRASLPRQC